MKRKLLTLLMIVIMACVAITMVACGDENDDVTDTHTHTLVKTDAVDASCYDWGNIAYWTCSDCEKIYSDAEATTEITRVDISIDMTAHAFTNGVCDVCHALEHNLNGQTYEFVRLEPVYADENPSPEIQEWYQNNWASDAEYIEGVTYTFNANGTVVTAKDGVADPTTIFYTQNGNSVDMYYTVQGSGQPQEVHFDIQLIDNGFILIYGSFQNDQVTVTQVFTLVTD